MTEIIEKSGLRWLWITAVLLILDQATKYWTVQALDLYESYEVLSFFNFTYARNYGAAFSFLGDAGGWQKYLFTSIAFAVSAYLLYSLKNNSVNKRWENIAFSLVLSGAIGNVMDRLMFGYVVDFLDFDLGFYRWPTFNVADIAIFIGAAMIILASLLYPEEQKDKAKEKENK
ncbi:lipoprotein signal peptidase [Psychromonas sp. psych-6C06]|uniref:signal peptidase II n=1 Tax=Psychromonas sp. psych-6C06 TaxID=2058089 RepID=UPI000C33D953|nr:signal peptidase II [Psychromonas sp. psych-6C06]PKF61224.1 lipoprotein signal peptidase [Psychromonas sp. psych-6C06]